MKKLFACLGLLAVLAMLCGQAARPQASSVSCGQVVTTYTTASYNCISDHSEKLRFERRVENDNKTGRVFYHGPGTLHQFQEVGLNPGTGWTYVVSELAGKKWRVAYTGTFTTPPPGPATAAVTAHTITLDGAPFFPTIAAVHLSGGCRPPDGVIDGGLAKGALVLYGNCGYPHGNGDDSYLQQRLPGVAWWLESDPQMAARMSLRELLRKKLQPPPTLPYVPDPDILVNNDGMLHGIVNKPCGVPETAVGLFEGIRFRSKEQAKPIIDSVDLRPIPRIRYFDNCLTLTRLRVLFYTAVCGGARGWMSYGDRASSIESNNVKPELMAAAWYLSRVELGVWGPVFFAPEVTVKHRPYTPLVGCAFRDKGVMSVFAINTGSKRMVSHLKVGGLGSCRLSVWREGRTLKAKKGVITDRFRQLTIHIYVCS